mmetsp:Transcript_89/g.233  ORF Transcript_89/g.233 Transcript_89/m.233 type:complete len:550 (-) Transcript_89:437-2086(-)
MGRSSARLLLGTSFAAFAVAQQRGRNPEEHPALAIAKCSTAGGCQTERTELTMDMQWRWLHNKDGYTNCIQGEKWSDEYCSDPTACAKNCASEGVSIQSYENDYKVKAAGDSLRLDFPQAPRVYMLDEYDKYKLFKLKNKEIAFDVDLSTLSCGLNAAIYLVEMHEDGDRSESNGAGAAFGSGYCDAQCPHMTFIQGQANTKDFIRRPAKTPELKEVFGAREGAHGYCCAEMDLLEGNRAVGVYTAHPCSHEGANKCEGKEECGDKEKGYKGWCDKDGCGFAPYRLGNDTFWGAGPGHTIDTTRPLTIITQFITDDGTEDGELIDIRRKYLQDNVLIENAEAPLLKSKADSMTDDYCTESNKVFDSKGTGFDVLGGVKGMGEALGRGMVLVLSVWDDNLQRMLWLDGEKTNIKEDPEDPGITRGPCKFEKGSDKDVKEHLEASGEMFVTFSNIRYGDLGSTYAPGAGVFFSEQKSDIDVDAKGSFVPASEDAQPPIRSAHTVLLGLSMVVMTASGLLLALFLSRSRSQTISTAHVDTSQRAWDQEQLLE